MTPDPKKLQMLIDREEIRDATLRYSRGLDRHDTELLISAYHPDARDDHGGFIGTREEFAEVNNALHAKNWVGHQHHMTNQVIEIDGDTAHCESYIIVNLVRESGIVDMAGSRYVDRLERRDGEWAITDRVCVLEWAGELAKGTQIPPSEWFILGRWDREDISYQRPLAADRPKRDLFTTSD
jgi:SnoaL-like domain